MSLGVLSHSHQWASMVLLHLWWQQPMSKVMPCSTCHLRTSWRFWLMWTTEGTHLSRFVWYFCKVFGHVRNVLHHDYCVCEVWDQGRKVTVHLTRYQLDTPSLHVVIVHTILQSVMARHRLLKSESVTGKLISAWKGYVNIIWMCLSFLRFWHNLSLRNSHCIFVFWVLPRCSALFQTAVPWCLSSFSSHSLKLWASSTFLCSCRSALILALFWISLALFAVICIICLLASALGFLCINPLE